MSTVGGEHDGALVVRVREPAEKGRATAAALKAVAGELAVPRRCITLISGATSRRKVIEIKCETTGPYSPREDLPSSVPASSETVQAQRSTS